MLLYCMLLLFNCCVHWTACALVRCKWNLFTHLLKSILLHRTQS